MSCRKTKNTADGESDSNLVRLLKQRLFALGTLYLLTGQESYGKQLIRIFEDAGNRSAFWNSHTVMKGEGAFLFTLVYDWLFPLLSTSQKTWFFEIVKTNCFDLFLTDLLKKPWWFTRKSNFNSTINGGVATAAIAFGNDNPSSSFEMEWLLFSARKSFESYPLQGFEMSSIWEEGPSYSRYFLEYFAYFYSTLETSGLETKLSFSHLPGFEKFPQAIVALQGQGDQVFSYADCDQDPIVISGAWYLAHLFQNVELAHFLKSYKSFLKHEGLALLFWDENLIQQSFTPTLSFGGGSGGASVVSFRSDFDHLGSYVALKGGQNEVLHGDLDQGSFVFESSGVRWFQDFGWSDYSLPGYSTTSESKNPHRWLYYGKRAEGHNVFVIGNRNARLDQKLSGKAQFLSLTDDPSSPETVLDLTSVFDHVSAAFRGIKLFDQRRNLLLHDRLHLTSSQSVSWGWQIPFSDGVLSPFANSEIAIDKQSVLLCQDQTLGGQRVFLKMFTLPASGGLFSLETAASSRSPAQDNDFSSYKRLAYTQSASGILEKRFYFYPCANRTLCNQITPHESFNRHLLTESTVLKAPMALGSA